MKMEVTLMMVNRWKANKLGVVNYWCYNFEFFEFKDGKMLLRGENASGKSVTMQVSIPLLLDGNRSARRLDSFGDDQRHMEYYLVGEEESEKVDETCYLYMEFKRELTDEYKTIGVGLRATKSEGIKSDWYFIISDNRRIDEDIFLYEETEEGRLPLSKEELEARICYGGRFFKDQKKYMRAVNNELFGFEKITDYKQYLDLLLKIRMPKLNKSFKPSTVLEILNDSLETLSEEDIKLTAEIVENLDNIEETIENLDRAKNILERFKPNYDRYNSLILLGKAKRLKESNKACKNIEKSMKESNKLLNEKNDELSRLVDERIVLDRDYNVAKEQINSPENEDAKRIAKKIQFQESYLKSKEDLVSKREGSIEVKKEDRLDLENKLKDEQDKSYKVRKDLLELLEDMGNLANDIDFLGHHDAEFMNFETYMDIDFKFNPILEYSKAHKEDIKNALRLTEEIGVMNERYVGESKNLSDHESQLEKEENELKKSTAELDRSINGFIDEICAWGENNKVFKLRQVDIDKLNKAISMYARSSSYSVVQRVVSNIGLNIKRTLEKKQGEYLYNRMLVDNELDEKQVKLSEINLLDYIEPERSKEVQVNRIMLEEDNVPLIPFFKAVDFVEGVDQDLRNIIEGNLRDMGIMDALIIPEEFKENVFNIDLTSCDKYIDLLNDVEGDNLSRYLKPSKEGMEIGEGVVNRVLNSVLLSDSGDTYIGQDGVYRIGIIQGVTSKSYVSSFIGEDARRSYKERLTLELEKEIEDLKSNKYKINALINEVNKDIDNLEIEEEGFPKNSQIEAIKDKIYKIKLTIENIKESLVNIRKKVDKLYKALREKIAERDLKTRKFAFNKKVTSYDEAVEAYKSALECMEEYSESLRNLIIGQNKLVDSSRIIDNLKAGIGSATEVIENYLYEIRGINEEIDTIKKMIEEYKKKELDPDKVSSFDELMKYQKIIDEYVGLRSDLVKFETKISGEIERLEQELGELKIRYSTEFDIREMLHNNFVEEYNFIATIKEKDVIKAELKDTLELANEILSEFKQESSVSRLDFEREFQKKYEELINELYDYSIKAIDVFSTSILDGDSDRVKEIKMMKKRVAITGFLGIDVHFYKLYKNIVYELDEKKTVLTENQNELTKVVLSQGIADKINKMIYTTAQWTKEMNRLLSTRKLSGGLTFSLEWNGIKGAKGNQLDTDKLMKIFKGDHEYLTKREFDKISKHFKSKIDNIRAEMKHNKVHKSYTQILKEVLNYRNWFEFKLYAQKDGESRKELTRELYKKFSGGQKALSAYAPLLAAAHSLLKKAREDSLRMIALDEAFAGVSDGNINDMFNYINSLEFDYIINSEKLWGTYEAIKSLSICVLKKKEELNKVIVLRFNWDGKQLTDLNGDEVTLEDIDLRDVELSESGVSV